MIDTRLIGGAERDFREVQRILSEGLPGNLPAAFVEWVALNGGASVRPSLEMPADGGAAVLEQFLSPEEIVSAYSASGGFSEAVPKEFVMVGYGPGGGLCISLRVDDSGSVWFADFDKAEDIERVDPGMRSLEIMIPVGKNWGSWLASR